MADHESTRVPIITARDQVPADARHHYDHIEETRGHVGGPFGPLFNSPELAGLVGRLGTYIRYQGILPGDDRELAIIATAREFDCAYEWAAHERVARDEHVRDEAIEAVANRAPLTAFSDDEAVVVRYVRELLNDHVVSDEAFEAAKDRFGVQGVTELTGTIGFYSMIASVLNAFEIRPGPDAPTLP